MSKDLEKRVDLQDFLSRCQARIEEHGCVIVWSAMDHLARMPPFAYTVGLSGRFKKPELLLFGLSHDDALVALNALVRRYLRPGFSVPVDAPLPRVVEDEPVIVKPVPIDHARHYARMAIAYGSHVQRQCLVQQVVVPDRRGKFPWESGYDRRHDRIQPRLFELQ